MYFFSRLLVVYIFFLAVHLKRINDDSLAAVFIQYPFSSHRSTIFSKHAPSEPTACRSDRKIFRKIWKFWKFSACFVQILRPIFCLIFD